MPASLIKHGQKVMYLKSCPRCKVGDVEAVKNWKLVIMKCVQCGWAREGTEKKK